MIYEITLLLIISHQYSTLYPRLHYFDKLSMVLEVRTILAQIGFEKKVLHYIAKKCHLESKLKLEVKINSEEI